jgi:hypothetical protein
MKKKRNKRSTLGMVRDTIRALMPAELHQAAGGDGGNPSGSGVITCVRSCTTG